MAPYSATLPTMTFSSALKVEFLGGYTVTRPPDRPCGRQGRAEDEAGLLQDGEIHSSCLPINQSE